MPFRNVCVAVGGTSLLTVATPGATASAQLPARTLDCQLGRISNFDPSKNQAPSDYVFAERHRLRLFLPAAAARTAPPPPSTQPAEPVDPATRLLDDQDGIIPPGTGRFDRVVDEWPDRVELTAPINAVSVNLFIVDQIDQARGRANLFLTRANDAVTYDLRHLYVGSCVITTD